MVRLMVGRDIDRSRRGSGSTPGAVRLKVNKLRTKRYPLCEVSFDVHGGEILGFAGLVGAGRSEVAQAIFGVDAPIGGTIELDDAVIRVKSAKDGIARGIFLAPEDRRKCGLVVEMTVSENITLPSISRYATCGLINSGREKAASEAASKSLAVKTPNVDFIVKNLSGGNQQKVVLAKWLSLGPKVMIFDEPTRGIDVGSKAEIYELMRNLAKEGVAIIMVSSDMEEVLSLSDRIAVMHEGRITGFLASEEANEESVMKLAVGAKKTSSAV
jgi:ribose transport system ATP-binding protein